MYVNDCQILNNGSDGIFVGLGSYLFLTGSTIQSNGYNGGGNGITVNLAGTVYLTGDATNVGNMILNNQGNGVSSSHGTVHIPGGTNSTISGNSGDGVLLDAASVGGIVGVTITGNVGHGVRIGDLSFAQFKGGGNSINGNNSPNVLCDAVVYAVRGVKSATSDTNCPPDISPLP